MTTLYQVHFGMPQKSKRNYPKKFNQCPFQEQQVPHICFKTFLHNPVHEKLQQVCLIVLKKTVLLKKRMFHQNKRQNLITFAIL